MPTRRGTPIEFLSELDNITTLGLADAAAVDSFGFGVTSSVSDARKLLDVASLPVAEGFESSAEALYEEFDQCILDAASDSDFAACLEQVHSSSLDELSGVIVKEGCDLLSSADDGTVVGLLGHVLHTVKAEGMEAALDVMSLRRLALRACVSASLHKLTVCVLPTVSACMVRAAPEVANVLHALVS